MSITHVEIVSIPVSDQLAAKAFFVDKLGFDVVRDDPMGEGRWIQLAPKGSKTTFSLVTWFETMPPGSLQGIMLITDDIDRTAADLQARGVEPTAIAQEPWGRYVMIKDLDGNGFVINELPDGFQA